MTFEKKKKVLSKDLQKVSFFFTLRGKNSSFDGFL